MAEFASKGVAGTGLGLGIAGTALGLLNNGNGGDGNGGILGILGGNNNSRYVSALQAENGMLKAENYSDRNSKEVYAQSLSDNRYLRDEMFAFLKPLSEEAANNRVEVAVLKEQAKALEKEIQCCCEKQDLKNELVKAELRSEIVNVANNANCGINAVNNALAGLSATVAKITETVIPRSAICPSVMPEYNSWTAPTTTPTTGG